ncbi:ABC transporter, partial [Desulfovibrio sp. OttesenSCG-928-I05]|nr:ABC transporter [Desulfovibrio sp. OttesenSCG-928-I05]
MNRTIFFDLLIYKTRANLRAEVSRLYLAYVWWVLNPLFNMAIFYIVFGIFMNNRQEHLALFLLLGTSQWQWFASTAQHAANSIWSAGNTMRQINIPKVFFPLE